MKSSLTRRQVLAMGAASSLLPQVSFAQNQSISLGDLESMIADEVMRLANGKAIDLSVLIPNGSAGNVAPVAEIFSRMTGVNIELSEVAVDGINTSILIDALSERGEFDVALPASFGLPDLVEANALKDLTMLAQQYEPAGYNDSALYSLGNSFGGSFYGYQTDGDVYLMFYNQKLMEENNQLDRYAQTTGQAFEIAKTWQALDAQMAFFHQPDQDRFGGALFRTQGYAAWEFWIRLHAKGVFPFSDSMEPLITSTEAEEALEELVRASEWQYPEADSNGLFENWSAFGQGNIFCNIGWGGTQKYLNGPQSNVAGNLIYAETPGDVASQNGKPLSYFNWGWNYTVAQNSANPEIAYLFTLFACGPKMSTLAVSEPDGYFDPFRTEHYSDVSIMNAYSKPFLDVHETAMQNCIPDLYLSGQGEYLLALQESVFRANSGDVSVKTALQDCANSWHRITRSRGRSSQVQQWQDLKSKYPA